MKFTCVLWDFIVFVVLLEATIFAAVVLGRSMMQLRNSIICCCCKILRKIVKASNRWQSSGNSRKTLKKSNAFSFYNCDIYLPSKKQFIAALSTRESKYFLEKLNFVLLPAEKASLEIFTSKPNQNTLEKRDLHSFWCCLQAHCLMFVVNISSFFPPR